MKPSKVHDRFWLQSWAPVREVTPRVGKWLVRVSAAEVDAAWKKVQTAVLANSLGPSAKVRTAMPHPIYTDDVKVICVYTKDSSDESDKARVRRKLKKLGFTQRLTYRTDAETMAGLECARQ